MKIVLSRKGLDSAAGGIPGPLVDGRPLSVPIPANGTPSGCRYGDLASPIPGIVERLGKGMSRRRLCHLDPDIDASVLRAPRPRGWRGSLGQVGAAQSHLAAQGVGRGDLFVFWGLFRKVERVSRAWRFAGRPEHRIFGWLQVDAVLAVGEEWQEALRRLPWLEGHPHLHAGWGASNTVYVASDALRLDGSDSGLAGFGRLRRGRRLSTADSRGVSTWNVPAWLDPSRGGTGMTYHPPARWLGDGTLRAAPRGQEFVAHVGTRRDALEWLETLIGGDATGD
ncbi:MAG: hypothetical protein OXM56_05770 [Gammaproteobacteria bacterium]|nr:hypothetical protein [Gammaproteobacteria bacterium]